MIIIKTLKDYKLERIRENLKNTHHYKILKKDTYTFSKEYSYGEWDGFPLRTRRDYILKFMRKSDDNIYLVLRPKIMSLTSLIYLVLSLTLLWIIWYVIKGFYNPGVFLLSVSVIGLLISFLRYNFKTVYLILMGDILNSKKKFDT